MTHVANNCQMTRRRPAERGAALFVVVMVITLLTAVGIFAARSTSLVDAATGYGRQASQTIALADYGAKLVATELGEGRARAYFSSWTCGINIVPYTATIRYRRNLATLSITAS